MLNRTLLTFALTLSVAGCAPAPREAIAPLKVVAVNQLEPLPHPCDGRFCRLYVRGLTFIDRDLKPTFTNSKSTITWSTASMASTVLQVTGGQFTASTNSSGNVFIPWTLGNQPQQPTVSIIGAGAAGGYRAAIVSTGTEGMTVQAFTASGAAARERR